MPDFGAVSERGALKAFKAGCLVVVFLVFAAGFWAKGVYDRGMEVSEATEPFLVRYEGLSSDEVFADLVERGLIAHPDDFEIVARLRKVQIPSATGTFELRGGMTMEELAAALGEPITQQVRIPEGWWIARNAVRLEEKNVCSAEDYIALAGKPEEFADVVSFELPKDSLEGYLYPDTYELPPLLGARGVIERQLRAFEQKVVEPLGDEGLAKAVIVGSMVEMEAGLDEERATIAGVIENRLARNMRLQIDATVMYALQEWRKLEAGEVNRVESPFNTYKIDGLPPGPIGSPPVRSIRAAMNPESHEYLYYVRGEGMSHLFGKDYNEHLRNIRLSNQIRRDEAAAKAEAS